MPESLTPDELEARGVRRSVRALDAFVKKLQPDDETWTVLMILRTGLTDLAEAVSEGKHHA